MIPVIINNFNRLSTTRKLVEQLQSLGYSDIHILDNGSTYPPLLRWYSTLSINVERLDNKGPLALYNSGYIREFKRMNWIAYTDSDIELNPQTPRNFTENLVVWAERHNFTKCGLALRIDNLPCSEYTDEIRRWEKKYWDREIEPDVYVGQVDTTFHIVNPRESFDYQALRIGGIYTAIHKPWYVNFDNLDEEEQWVIDNSQHNLSTYRRQYFKHKN